MSGVRTFPGLHPGYKSVLYLVSEPNLFYRFQRK